VKWEMKVEGKGTYKINTFPFVGFRDSAGIAK
jgi:hypothetical protein